MTEQSETRTAADSGSRSGAGGHWWRAAAAVTFATLPSMTSCLPVFRDRLQNYYGLNNAEFGLLLNIGGAVGFFGALAGGPLMDHIGAHKTLRLSLAGCAAGMLLAAVPGPWMLMLLALGLVALFFAPLNIALQAYLVALFPHSRRRVLSMGLVAASAITMTFPLLAELLLRFAAGGGRASFGWVLHGLFACTALALGAGVLLTGRTCTPEMARRTAGTPPEMTLPAGAIVLLTALLALHGTVDSALAVWIPRVLASASYPRQVLLPGVVVSAFSLAYVVSRGLLSAMPETKWRRRMMVAPGLCGGAILLAGILSRDQFWTSIAYVAGAFCWSVEYPVLLAALTGAGRRFGTAMSALSAASGLGAFVLATSLGALGDHLGETQLWRILLIPACGFPLVGLGGLWWVLQYGQRLAGQEQHSAVRDI